MKRYIAVIAIAFGACASAAAASLHGIPESKVVGRHDLQITLEPGQSVMLPMPTTKYPGSPFSIIIVDPGLQQSPSLSGCWIAKATISAYGGGMSFIGQFSSGPAKVGTVAAGGAAKITAILGTRGVTAVALSAEPLGSAEGLQLTAGGSFGTQTFIVRYPDDGA